MLIPGPCQELISEATHSEHASWEVPRTSQWSQDRYPTTALSSEEVAAESWATQRAALARDQALQPSRSKRHSSGPLEGPPEGSTEPQGPPREAIQGNSEPRPSRHPAPKQRPASPTDTAKPHYPAATPAYAYAIQPGRADAIMAAAERSVGAEKQLDEATMQEMMSEAALSQAPAHTCPLLHIYDCLHPVPCTCIPTA